MCREVDVEITSEGSGAVVAFKGTSISGMAGVVSASKQIKEFIEKNHPRRIVFDFEQVKFFSSQVLGLLLDVRAKLAACDGEVVISAIDPQLHKVFRITHLDKIFRFFPDKKTAIRMANTS